jgi:transcriptional regulator with XRE-family HTH domain
MIGSRNLSDYLKRLRKGLSLSQTQIAERLGISQQKYSGFESGGVLPSNPLLLKRFADVFGTTVEELRRHEEMNSVVDYCGDTNLVPIMRVIVESGCAECTMSDFQFLRTVQDGLSQPIKKELVELLLKDRRPAT